jgi:pSer/pThr/pTyr-binding forkhead associated (FHA) protein
MPWVLEIFEKDKDVPLRICLKDGVTTMGREDCDVSLDDSKISRHHCSLYLSAEDLSIIDQNSSNGTFINGVRVEKKDLVHLDTIIIGSTHIFAKREN